MGQLFHILSLAVAAVYMAAVIWLLKKGMLYLRYALLWLLTGAVMIVLVIWPQAAGWFFDLCGFRLFSNGLFAVLILFILLILLAVTCIVSRLNEKNRRLVQELALLEKRVRELEGKEERG